MPQNVLFSHRVDRAPDWDHPVWGDAEPIFIDRNWQGRFPGDRAEADPSLATSVRSAWDAEGFYLHYDCAFSSLYTRPQLGEGGPINRLWDYDVVEAFVRPRNCSDYFEFQVSPLGQWQDIHILKPREEVDFDWSSGLRASVRLDRSARRWRTLLRIPFAPLLEAGAGAERPEAGDAWRINLFRIAGREEEKEYLSWRPTLTEEPDYHVPAAFGHLLFLDRETAP